MRAQIERELGLTAINFYGLSEIVGPGVSVECPQERNGLHVNEDHFLVEVVDPQTGAPLGPGEEGELVFTTLTKEALPLVRYRTADIASLSFDTCPCGRTLARMSAVRGRSDDMLIIRGVNVFPSQIEELLLKQDRLAPHYVLEVRRDGHLDDLDVLVERRAEMPAAAKVVVEQDVERSIKGYIGVSAKVHVVEPGTVQRSQGKAVRVIDKRPKS